MTRIDIDRIAKKRQLLGITHVRRARQRDGIRHRQVLAIPGGTLVRLQVSAHRRTRANKHDSYKHSRQKELAHQSPPSHEIDKDLISDLYDETDQQDLDAEPGVAHRFIGQSKR
jgi:hypothetical protein